MEKTEVWKSLDFMGYPNYEVSNFGRVKSLKGKEINAVVFYGDTKNSIFFIYN